MFIIYQVNTQKKKNPSLEKNVSEGGRESTLKRHKN